MATYSDAELLQKVREAIARILDGSVRRINQPGTGMETLSLTELRQMEADLTRRVASSASGSSTLVQY